MSALLEWDAAMQIGERIMEMADRVKVGHAVVPGTKAEWEFEMDGTAFAVVITVASVAPATRNSDTMEVKRGRE